MRHYLFTSESVGKGHPDKIADQISDAILDACLAVDPFARVACEALVKHGLVILAGEVTTTAVISYEEIARKTIEEIGYTSSPLGIDAEGCGVIVSISKQSPDIALGVIGENMGAGDQGLMFGFACDDTPDYMPFPIAFSHEIMREVCLARETHTIPYLRPDGKSQVTVEYDEEHRLKRIHTVVVSVQHNEEVSQETIHRDMIALVKRLSPKGLIDDETLFFINPTGRFVIGGPDADCGLTGRKIIVDTYGGMGRHGGGSFSGKDATKVDRSGAYAARHVAKNIVAAGLARRCEVQVAYAIGVPYPVAIRVDTQGTGAVNEEILEKAVPLVFDLTPRGMIEMLDLRRPIYKKTAFGGHFGRRDPEFTWEKTDKVDLLKEICYKSSSSSLKR